MEKSLAVFASFICRTLPGFCAESHFEKKKKDFIATTSKCCNLFRYLYFFVFRSESPALLVYFSSL